MHRQSPAPQEFAGDRKDAGYAPCPTVLNSMAKLNLGGGPGFVHPGWMNLEGVASAQNPFPFDFNNSAIFPIPSGAMPLVYSSHCLEHLDDETVGRTLDESRRVLQTDGALFLKLPDFDKGLAEWRRGDGCFFSDRQWGLESVTDTWLRCGLRDTLDMRASMVFCGFWNTAYGDHFSGNIKSGGGAYHGPSRQTPTMAEALRRMDHPHEIAAILRDSVKKNESSYVFNHQNAWGRQELSYLLAQHGFRVLSFDKNAITSHFAEVPAINEMFDLSMYCVAEPL